VARAGDGSAPATEYAAAFTALLPPGGGWQLVLLWDLLDYLPGNALAGLGDALRPALGPKARLHGFVTSQNTQVPAQPAVYELRAGDRVVRHVRGEATRQATRFTPWDLKQRLSGFDIDASRQRRDGRQEHLFIFDTAPAGG